MDNEKSLSVFYPEFLNEARAIIVETVVSSRTELIKGKWLLGKLIIDNQVNFDRAEIYGEKLVKKISKDLKTSERNLYHCLKFYKENVAEDFENIANSLPKNASWFRLTQKSSPEIEGHQCDYQPKECWQCKVCDKKVFSNPNENKE